MLAGANGLSGGRKLAPKPADPLEVHPGARSGEPGELLVQPTAEIGEPLALVLRAEAAPEPARDL